MKGGGVSLVMQPLRAHHVAHEAEEYPAMSQSTTEIRIVPLPKGQDVLTDLLRDGARRMLAQAVEAEVAAWIDAHDHLVDDRGRRQVVRNGHLPDAPNLSATTVTRLKAVWEADHEAWSKRSLAGKRYVYVWADGVHFNIRLEGGRQCILVVMGATAEGKKELIAISDGYRESDQSWKELLLDCKARGLEVEPSLAIGDGALGFWKAIRQIWDTAKEQRCWVHKTANVLDKMPNGVQAKAKAALHEIDGAETKADAEK